MKLSQLITEFGDKELTDIVYDLHISDLQCLVSVSNIVYENKSWFESKKQQEKSNDQTR